MNCTPATALSAMLFFALNAAAVAQVNHHQAFQQFGEFMVGNWTPADQDSELGPRKHVYAWTLDNKFVSTDAADDPTASWQGFFGIEPKSGKLAWWACLVDGAAPARSNLRTAAKSKATLR